MKDYKTPREQLQEQSVRDTKIANAKHNIDYFDQWIRGREGMLGNNSYMIKNQVFMRAYDFHVEFCYNYPFYVKNKTNISFPVDATDDPNTFANGLNTTWKYFFDLKKKYDDQEETAVNDLLEKEERKLW